MWWRSHLLISAFLGIVYFAVTKNIVYSFLFFSFGFFIDIDHYILYLIVGKNMNFFDIYRRFRGIKNKIIPDLDEDKYVLPFHNFEFVLALVVPSYFYPPLVPVALGVLLHFAIDVLYVRKFRIKHYYSAIYYAVSKLT
jgi:hypothetical protein